MSGIENLMACLPSHMQEQVKKALIRTLIGGVKVAAQPKMERARELYRLKAILQAVAEKKQFLDERPNWGEW